MTKTTVLEALNSPPSENKIEVQAWVRTFRSNRFIALNDGSTIHNLQAVINFEEVDESLLKQINTGACVCVVGKIAQSLGKGQSVELQVSDISLLGEANPDEYPLQPKKHSLEFLREKAHLRMRTATFSAIFRVRHALSFAVHHYFNQNGFYNMHTPIITGSDAEGAGEMFKVTNLDLNKIPKTEDGKIDYSEDFFAKETNLTVSGQLEAELAALALSKVYTFGPTFRAENSNTSRHLAEFWMIEPEVAFCDLNGNMDLAQDFLKKVIANVMENCKDDLAFLNDRFTKEEMAKPKLQRSEMDLLGKLKNVVDNDFIRLSYTEAIEILRNSKPNKKKKFKYLIDGWGVDLQSEHERYLVEKHFKMPVILYDYPANIKAFYMRLNEDEKTVRAMDVLFPGIGEIIGGSQREERYDVLKQKISDMGIDEKELWWYLETRKFGTCVHSGFGLGFERLVQFVTGMGNIRDVIPFPRTPGKADF